MDVVEELQADATIRDGSGGREDRSGVELSSGAEGVNVIKRSGDSAFQSHVEDALSRACNTTEEFGKVEPDFDLSPWIDGQFPLHGRSRAGVEALGLEKRFNLSRFGQTRIAEVNSGA